MVERINDIIAKVRAMYKYDDRFNELVKMHPTIKLEEKKKGEIELVSIDWHWYDSIYVYPDHIEYSPEYGPSKKLITYKNWHELLEL